MDKIEKLKNLKIIILGKPCAGKGTQSELLSKYLNLPIIPTGELYRQEIENNTEIGKLAKQLIEVGCFMPDEITNQLISSKIHNRSNGVISNGFIIEGYPRTINQAEFIKDKINTIININISDEAVYERAFGRLVHKQSGRTYHTSFNPPKISNKDDVTGETLIRRKDDTPEITSVRLATYYKECSNLALYYQDAGMNVFNVDGMGSIEKVYEDIKSSLGIGQ